jgi:hypothetical protein
MLVLAIFLQVVLIKEPQWKEICGPNSRTANGNIFLLTTASANDAFPLVVLLSEQPV